jgi:hypothetical protein
MEDLSTFHNSPKLITPHMIGELYYLCPKTQQQQPSLLVPSKLG